MVDFSLISFEALRQLGYIMLLRISMEGDPCRCSGSSLRERGGPPAGLASRI